MQKVFHKKFLIIIMAALIISSLTFSVFSPSIAQAQVNQTTSAQSLFSPPSYFYFNNPSAVFADADKLYVADSSSVEIFDGTDFSHSGSYKTSLKIDKFAVFSGKIALLSGNNLYIDSLSVNEDGQNTRILLDSETSDFCIYDGELFITANESVYKFDLSSANSIDTKTKLLSLTTNAKSLTVSGKNMFVTAKSLDNQNFDDIYLYEYTKITCNFKSVLTAVPSIISVTRLTNNSIASLTRSGINLYNVVGSEIAETQSASDTSLTAICANSSKIFALTSYNSIINLDFNLSGKKQILAAASSETDFFYSPVKTYTRKGSLAVADEKNNRVVIKTEKGNSYIDGVTRPKTAAIDVFGNFYVSCNVNQIRRYDSNLAFVSSIETAGNSIIDIKFNSNNDMYALSSSGILFFASSGQTSLTALNDFDAPIKDFEVSYLSDNVYIAGRGKIFLYEGSGQILSSSKNLKAANFSAQNAGKIIAEYDPNIFTDFCLDHDNSVYILTNGGNVLKFKNNVLQTELPQVKGISRRANQIIMNTTPISGLSALKYGDLIVTDTAEHCLKKIDGLALKVNENFETEDTPFPDTSTPPKADASMNQILYTIKTDCEVYGQAAEIKIKNYLNAESTVIIPSFDARQKFTFIISDNTAQGTQAQPIFGYVYTSFINSEPKEYTSNHPLYCHTWLNNVPIYSYPSRNAPIYSKFSSLPQNTSLKLFDFAFTSSGDTIKYGYEDNFSAKNIWYKVGFGDDYVGYVTSDFITFRGENPDLNIYPRNNAIIIPLDGDSQNIGALVYVLSADGTFEVREDIAPIPTGTKVEVVGAFDSTKPYTQIKYLTEYGTIEVWVNTKNIEYDGINTLQIAAIIMIILTAILVIIIVCRFVYNKRHIRVNKQDIMP